MNESRFRQLEQGQTSIARKVLEVVPLAEWWSARQVMGELHRQGQTRDFSVVEGCLRSLREAGLIRVKEGGVFQRISITYKTEESMATAPIVMKTPPAAQSPTDRLLAAGTRARYLGQELINLAKEIDDAILAMEEQTDAREAEFAGLRQLKTLLKGLS